MFSLVLGFPIDEERDPWSPDTYLSMDILADIHMDDADVST